MATLTKGNFNVKGKNYSYTFQPVSTRKFLLEISENKHVDEVLKSTEFRKVRQSLTSWEALDPKKQKEVDKIIQKEGKDLKVIDSKINEIEVKPVVNETELIQEVEVKKTVKVFKPLKPKKLDIFINLSSTAVRVYAQNYINSLDKPTEEPTEEPTE